MKLSHQVDWSTIVSRVLLFSLVWWVLSEGNAESVWIGVAAVSFAVIVSAMLLPPVPLIWHELFMFVPFFLWRSLQGGVDVARRAFHPRLPITPELLDYPLRLPPGLPRVMLANIVSLLPGTLSATLNREVLKIHVLDGEAALLASLDTLEERVGKVCGVSLAPRHEYE